MKTQPIWARMRSAHSRKETPVKVFSYTVKQLFDGRDSAKLKNQKSLKAVGEFLAQNQFGVAVITASTGMEGDSQKDTVLTEARL